MKRGPRKKNRHLPKGISYVRSRNRYRVQINGVYYGSSKSYVDACIMLSDATRDPRKREHKQRGRNNERLPVGIQYLPKLDLYRVRLYHPLIKRAIEAGSEKDLKKAEILLRFLRRSIETWTVVAKGE